VRELNGAECLASAIGATQSVSPPPPQRKDAATVSAGISKEQLTAAQSLNDVLATAEHAQRAGDASTRRRAIWPAPKSCAPNTALPILCDAEVNFGAAAKPGGSKEFRMIEA